MNRVNDFSELPALVSSQKPKTKRKAKRKSVPMSKKEFVSYVALLHQGFTVAHVAKQAGVTDSRVWSVLYTYSNGWTWIEQEIKKGTSLNSIISQAATHRHRYHYNDRPGYNGSSKPAEKVQHSLSLPPAKELPEPTVKRERLTRSKLVSALLDKWDAAGFWTHLFGKAKLIAEIKSIVRA